MSAVILSGPYDALRDTMYVGMLDITGLTIRMLPSQSYILMVNS